MAVKRVIIGIILLLFIFGCSGEETVRMKGVDSEDIFNDCIKFANITGSSITYTDKKLGIINVTGGRSSVIGVMFPSLGRMNFNINKINENDIELKIIIDTQASGCADYEYVYYQLDGFKKYILEKYKDKIYKEDLEKLTIPRKSIEMDIKTGQPVIR